MPGKKKKKGKKPSYYSDNGGGKISKNMRHKMYKSGSLKPKT